MYKVILHKSSGEASEYSTQFLHYAKRYADLYKAEYPYVEIIKSVDGADTVIEIFGSKTN